MTEPIPKWLQIKFAQLWRTFEGKEFTMVECQEALGEKKREVVAVILSRLRSMGWIEVKPDEEDNRRKTYRLFSPELILRTIETKEEKEHA